MRTGVQARKTGGERWRQDGVEAVLACSPGGATELPACVKWAECRETKGGICLGGASGEGLPGVLSVAGL